MDLISFRNMKRYTDAFSIDGKNTIPVLVNYDSCTEEEYEWLLKNMQAVGLKNGMFSHGYHISFGKTRLANWNDFKRKLAEKNGIFFQGENRTGNGKFTLGVHKIQNRHFTGLLFTRLTMGLVCGMYLQKPAREKG